MYVKHRLFNFQSIFRTLAIIFVLNSHLDGFYPSTYFSSGGGLGNTMFFFISGFSILSRVNINNLKELFNLQTFIWIYQRLKRLYIPLWFYLSIFSLINFVIPNFIINFQITYNLRNLIFPTSYWFIGELVILYSLVPLISFLEKLKLMRFIYVVMLVIYFLVYFNILSNSNYLGLFVEHSSLKYIYYALVFFGSRNLSNIFFDNNLINSKKFNIRFLVILLILIISIIFFRINLSREIFFKFQFLYQFFTLLICLN